MYYHVDDFFFDSFILSINRRKKFITLENGLIKINEEITDYINDNFIAMFSLKTREEFLFFYYECTTGSFIFEIKDISFNSIIIHKHNINSQLEILDVFLDLTEKNSVHKLPEY